MVASYGDCLYEVSENWSTDCSRTIRAAFLMQEKLAISEEVSKVTKDAIKAVKDTLRKTNVSEEHPLESYCRSIEKDFAQNSNLSVLFEKVKEVTKLDNVTCRLPYSRVLLKSEVSLQLLLIDKLDIPELAKLFAGMSFKKFLDNSDYSPSLMDIFVKTCVAMAKKERFSDSIQKIFEKTLIDTVPEIGVPDRAEKFNSFSKDGVLFWVPKMMRVFYGYIAGDPILKKEFDSLAAVKFPKAQKEDLDFSNKLLNGLKNKAKFPPIPLYELVEELRREPVDVTRPCYLLFIMAVASYGDRLYDVYPDLSVECSKTIKATTLLEATLATTVEANEVIEDTINAVVHDLKNAADFRIEKAFAANSNLRLSASFEKAKKKAANLKNASSRPAYSPVLLKSFESLFIQMFHSLDFPKYANVWARESFPDLPIAVARKEQFFDSMQNIYEKTMGDVVSANAAKEELEKMVITDDGVMWWWVPKMMKIFYGYVANDAILKKEVDSMAASMFPSASKEDLNFAKL
ncbi:hypothetical protein V9T40_001579 [Parthenolecanium corni]|uniref:Uncharacterized protein n=1 Tax=Parthenolecanium corni TaxID=536013 RepID=A0AAN9TKG9_9HEMI